ncbi:cell division protein FtsQ [Oleomonas cavernae]|uniref:Cell division protein FtsQ n=1 Tax=Oleomonas cavernae TaxID=2320859 RepID=A0A418WDB7_9PROT|nr:cell division protein FtsQ [Oleomonas cavernae]RJF87939.1 cell division protein FtsQ [Oleomonas cavernae]
MSEKGSENRETGPLPGLVLALVLVAGLISGLSSLLSPQGGALLKRATLADVAAGRTTGELSRLLNDDLLAGATLAQAARAIDWLAVGDLGAAVRRGCDGWLFLREELEIHADPAQAMARRADLVARVATQLRARGIGLVIAVAPDKSRIESRHLCGLARPAILDDRLAGFNALLTARGVETADLAAALRPLDGERYYRTDTHWNERGARAAAQAIATRLVSSGRAPPRAGEATLTPGAPVERIGDLIRLAGLGDVPAGFRPAGDVAASTNIVQPSLGGDDLLGDAPGPPVVMIGSSFSRNANFIGFLAAALGVPVGDMARDGAGFDGAARAYFANAAFRDTPPAIVIWEIPERVIDAPAAAAEQSWDGDLAAKAP